MMRNIFSNCLNDKTFCPYGAKGFYVVSRSTDMLPLRGISRILNGLKVKRCVFVICHHLKFIIF